MYSDQVTVLAYHFLPPAGPWEPFVVKQIITSSPLRGFVEYYAHVKIIIDYISDNFSKNCSFFTIVIDAPDRMS